MAAEEKSLGKTNYRSIKSSIEDAFVNSEWHQYRPLYKNIFSSIDCDDYCKIHSMFEVILDLQKKGTSLRTLYHILVKYLLRKKALRIYIGSYPYFVSKVKFARSNSIRDAITNRSKLHEKNGKKFSKYCEHLATRYYRNTKLTYSEIHSELNVKLKKLGKPPISMSSLKHFFRNRTFRSFNTRQVNAATKIRSKKIN